MNVTLEVSDEELVEIANLLARLRQDAKLLASPPPITAEERRLFASHSLLALESVRDRIGCSLIVAKRILESDMKSLSTNHVTGD